MRAVGIDPGIVNLGYVVGRWVDGCLHVDTAGRVDLTARCRAPGCRRRRGRELYDRLQHLLCHGDLGPALEEADAIVVERQPPGGLVSVSDFFLAHWRDKVHLVAPRAMHCWMQIGDLGYDGRKAAVEAAADAFVALPTRGRRHDVADALCILLYWLVNKWRPPRIAAADWMDRFRYVP